MRVRPTSSHCRCHIHEGNRVDAGQIIEKFGNSGNSGAPHLHFQVLDSARPPGSTGMPFIFDQLEVRERILETEGFVVEDFLHGKPIGLDTAGSDPQEKTMLITSTVYDFH
jgi:murein DD-endopeptidase MepM/ murein hydrolase activator NlpD